MKETRLNFLILYTRIIVLPQNNPIMKEKTKKTVLIYFGASMIAQGLVARLEELGITPILINDTASALRTGFALALNDQVRLLIREDELEIAKEVIDTYLKEVGED